MFACQQQSLHDSATPHLPIKSPTRDAFTQRDVFAEILVAAARRKLAKLASLLAIFSSEFQATFLKKMFEEQWCSEG